MFKNINFKKVKYYSDILYFLTVARKSGNSRNSFKSHGPRV